MYLDTNSYLDEDRRSELLLNIDLAYELKEDIISTYEPDLVEAQLEVIFRDHQVKVGNKIRVGSVRKLYGLMRYAMTRIFDRDVRLLMELDYNYWLRYDDHLRKKLVHHELKHVYAEYDEDKDQLKRDDKTGEIIWKIKGHDKEEFYEIDEIYGPEWEH